LEKIALVMLIPALWFFHSQNFAGNWICRNRVGYDFVVLKVLTVRKIRIETAIMAAATGAE
jgi:hypothetical protein